MWFSLFDDGSQNETMPVVLKKAFLIVKLFKSSVEEHEKKVFELLHHDNPFRKVNRYKLKRVTSYSEVVQETFSRMLEGQEGFRSRGK